MDYFYFRVYNDTKIKYILLEGFRKIPELLIGFRYLFLVVQPPLPRLREVYAHAYNDPYEFMVETATADFSKARNNK